MPWLDPTKKGRAHERTRARGNGGRLRPGSGNKPGFKEDIRYSEVLEQVKSTAKGSYRIQASSFLATQREAAKEGRIGQLVIIFERAGRGGKDLKLVVREEEDWEP